MNYLLGWIAGYVTYNLVAPTAVGRVLDKVSFPPKEEVTPHD